MGFVVDAVKSVGKAVVGVVKGVVNVVKGVVKAAVSVVSSVISFVAQPFMGLMGGIPEIGDQQEAQRQQGVLVQVQGGGAQPIPVVYGYRKVGGIVTFAETGATNNKYLWVVYTFCEGPVNGLREIFLNDEPLPATVVGGLNGGQTVSITEGKFKGRVTMRWSPGVYFTDPAASTLGTELKNNLFKDAQSFKNTMTHNGLACLFVRYEWLEITTQEQADANPFSGSIPTMQIGVLGRRVASLETSTSEGFEYGAVGYSERHSYNPAEILLDYLRNPRYGKGLKNSEIDWPSWRIAAAKCNTIVTYTSTNVRGPILTCNYVLDTGYTIFQNTKLLLQGFRAYMPYVQGKYKLRIEDAGNETDILSGQATIIAECTSDYQVRDSTLLENQYDIMGDITYTGIERSAKYNCVVVTYVEPDQKWSTQQVIYPTTEAERQTFIALDGGRENKLEVTFPTITNAAIAWDMARLLFNKSRYQETASLRVSSQAFELEPGDNIRIQSQILNFGNTPWRVVNISYNDDYTFDLNCVRNPDSLYPYTRVGEPDRVLPIFVPKGANIYYPVELDKLPLGLVPPSTIPFSGNGTTLNPKPPSTIGTDGGGVGGGSSPVNADNPNNTPPGTPVVLPLTDVIDVSTVRYVDKNGLRYGTITFRQPAHPMYQGVNFFWALSGSRGTFQTLEDRQKPGSGNTITLDLGPIAMISSIQAQFNKYTVYARVIYSTGEYSTRFVTFELDPTLAVGTVVNVSETVNTITSSVNTWPTITITPTRRDNTIDTVSAEIIAPVPQTSTRTMTFRITQDARNEGFNYDVTGFNVYYKAEAATYWKKASHTFPAGYAPGTVVDTPFTGSIGTTGQPAIYSVAIRLTYKDGTESTKQFVASFRVESVSYSAPRINLLYGIAPVSVTGITKTGVMNVTELDLITEDLAPPGAVVNALDMNIGIDTVSFAGGFNTGLSIVLYPPNEQNRLVWQGIRIYYRPIVNGQNPPLTRVDFTSATDITLIGNTTRVFTINEIKHDTYYELIAVPLVLNGSTNFVESNNCVMGVGYVTRNRNDPLYPGIFTVNGDPNWVNVWRFQNMQTLTAKNQGGKLFTVGEPFVNVTGCFTVNKWNQFEFDRNGMKQRIGEFIELTFDNTGISNYESLYIYRRAYRSNAGANGEQANYYGVGRWELVIVTGGSGSQTVNLRFPAHWTQFNEWFERPNNPRYRTQGITLYNDYTVNGRPAGILPISTGTDTELLLIVKTTTVLSTKGVLLSLRSPDFNVVRTNQLMNQSFPVKPQVIDYATTANIRDSDFLAGYDRRLSDARSVDIPQANRFYRGTWSPTDINGNPRPTYGYDLIAGYPPVDSGSAIV